MPQRKYEIIRFNFTTALHIGNERSDYGSGDAFLQSDALYAAICFSWARLGKKEWIPTEDHDHNGFIISSLFPFVEHENGFSYFLPKPLLLSEERMVDPSIDTSSLKALKKIHWIDLPVFEALAGGNPLPYHKTYYDKGYQSVKELPKDSQGKLIDPVGNQVMPRVSISRTGNEDTTYYIDRYYFHERAGLFAFAYFKNEEIKSRVITALRLLEDEGIGTDRNVGHGKFIFSMDSLSLNLPHEGEYGVNIGMYCPRDKQEWQAFSEYGKLNARAGYNLVRRGGWMSEPYNTWRKRSVYMAQPGGIFKSSGKSSAGKVVNVEPTREGINAGHPVWRNGKSLFLPCKG
ncbi:MAG TPA: type III-A CRISPR-associated RAMP protein Csm4 [Niabella sp.]|nr:type III-A CRISPR-associated RAMP protein Csm4 [Niabella sp.]